MTEKIELEATGVLYKMRDPEGASFRFVTEEGPLTSAVIFREGNIIDGEEIVKYNDVKFMVTIEIVKDDKEFGIDIG